MVRKYRNTIQNPYTAASAANVSGSLQTVLSKVTWPSAPVDTRGVSRRVTSDRMLAFLKSYLKLANFRIADDPLIESDSGIVGQPIGNADRRARLSKKPASFLQRQSPKPGRL